MSKFRELFKAVLQESNFNLNEGIVASNAPVARLVNRLDYTLQQRVKTANEKLPDNAKISVNVIVLPGKGHDFTNKNLITSYYLNIIQTRPIEVFAGYPMAKVPVSAKVRCSTHDKPETAKDIEVYIPNTEQFADRKTLQRNDLDNYNLSDSELDEYISAGIKDLNEVWNNKISRILNALKKINAKTLGDVLTLPSSEIITKYTFLDQDSMFYKIWFKDWIKEVKAEYDRRKAAIYAIKSERPHN